jgi:hypothetical protein
MSKKVAPRVQLNFAPEEKEEEIDEQEVNLPVEVPEVIERDEIVENDIFDNVNPSLNGMGEDIIIDEIQDEEVEPTPKPKPVSKPKPKKQPQPQPQQEKVKKKRQLSEEHKAKLALAREKALATRRAKAEEKKKMKEIENKTKELKKKKAQKDLEQLEDEVTNHKPVNQRYAPLKTSLDTTSYPTSMFTKKDLEDAQLEAIMKYEAIRKARKEEKKKQQMIDDQKKELQRKIQGYGARDSNGRLLNKWDRCY